MCVRWTSTTFSSRSSSASHRSRPPSPAPPSSASAGAASSPTPSSPAASAPTTGRHPSSASCSATEASSPPRTPRTASPSRASPWVSAEARRAGGAANCSGAAMGSSSARTRKSFCVWVDSVATLVLPSPTVFIHYPSTLVGNAVYWLLDGVILQFDLETQSLAIIEKPPDANVSDDLRCQIMATEDARFGLAVLAESSILFWKRETDPSSGAKWVLCRTVQLDRLLPLGKKGLRHPLGIMGISEENNVIFLGTYFGIFMIHLESMQFRKVFEQTAINYIFPYSSF